MRQREQHSMIPEDIRAVFDKSDIPKIWDYLESFFHLSKDYRKIYDYELKELARNITEQEFCYYFIRQNIEPHIAALLKQKDCLNRIIRYLLKKKIEEYKINQRNSINYYKQS